MSDNVLFELDLESIQRLMAAFTLDIFSGRTPEMTNQQVVIEIPKGISDVIVNIAERFEISPEQVFSKMASEGLNQYFKTQIAAVMTPQIAKQTKEDPMATLKAMGVNLDFSGLQAQMGQLQNLGSKFAEIQKALDDKGTTGTNSK